MTYPYVLCLEAASRTAHTRARTRRCSTTPAVAPGAALRIYFPSLPRAPAGALSSLLARSPGTLCGCMAEGGALLRRLRRFGGCCGDGNSTALFYITYTCTHRALCERRNEEKFTALPSPARRELPRGLPRRETLCSLHAPATMPHWLHRTAPPARAQLTTFLLPLTSCCLPSREACPSLSTSGGGGEEEEALLPAILFCICTHYTPRVPFCLLLPLHRRLLCKLTLTHLLPGLLSAPAWYFLYSCLCWLASVCGWACSPHA